MSTALATIPDQNLNAIEQALVQGNIGALTQAQRINYYNELCKSLGLNPLTQPFEYLTLNGKVRLYAKKDATDQLRKIHSVSVVSMETQKVEDVHIVVVRVRDKEGREDIGTGAVPLGSLKGEALANALMKGETKAKRRATLSICGLGFLDETEIDSIPRHEQFEAAKNYEVNESTPVECEKCGKQIIDIKNPDPTKGKYATLTAMQAIAYSEKHHNASWCWDCIIAAGKPKHEEPQAVQEQPAEPQYEAEPDPCFSLDTQNKPVVSGTVTETFADAKSFALKMGKERFSTFSASVRDALKDCKGQRVVLEYRDNEKGGKVYHNIVEVRRIGNVEYDNGVPVTDINADLHITKSDAENF
jgi:hypothetical protein